MTDAEGKLRHALDERISQDSLRELTVPDSLVDFCSNDYLGFARSQKLKDRIHDEENRNPVEKIGSTGSRLISGNSRYCEDLEKYIAAFHNAEAGLIFNSGYDANVGVFSSIPQRTDVVLYDRLVHASIRDGIRLGHAKAFSFEHNDLNNLERRLKSQTVADSMRNGGNVFVAVESVYSMDGDGAPLAEIVRLCKNYGAGLVVDEAHATGVFGPRGEGKVVELGLEREVFARIHTFGKSLGTHGAIVLGPEILRSYLVNFARSFIYTTALPFHSLASIRCAYEFLSSDARTTMELREKISFFKESIVRDLKSKMIQSESAIQCILIPGNLQVRKSAREIQDAGFDVRPIMHPTVPAGSERLRICIHSFNTEEEIRGLTEKLRESIT